MITETQIPERYRVVINEQIDIYNSGRSITVKNDIPDTSAIPIENPKHWLRIPNVICVFVDIIGSTKLSAEQHDKSTAGVYQLFTGTAVKLFNSFETPYIDVRGDGVFALFNNNQLYRSIAAAVTFKTFAKEEFVQKIKGKTGLEVGCHIGIDQKTLLVRKIGLKRHNSRTDRQNEVWAGKPVNMASKLASLCSDNEMLISDRIYNRINSDLVLKSCGCPSGEKMPLWSEIELTDNFNFDFNKAYKLTSVWCAKHGSEYCNSILLLDNDI